MAFGSLASLKPSNTLINYSLYTAPTQTFVEGRVYIVNRNSFPIKFSVGLSTSSASEFQYSGYIAFKKELQPDESFETETLYFANGETVIVNSDNTNITFNFLGKEIPHLGGGGFLESLDTSTTATNQTVYTVDGTTKRFNGNLFVCNRNPSSIKFRLAVGSTADGYVVYNTELEPFQTFEKTNLRISSGESILFKSSDLRTNVVFTAKPEDYTYFYGNVGIESAITAIDYVGQRYYASEKIGIGVSTSPYELEVVGHTEIDTLHASGNVNIDGNLAIGGGTTISQNLRVEGSSTFVGNATFEGGTINLGNQSSDNVVFQADVNSNILPETTLQYDLGSPSQEWKRLYVDHITSTGDLFVSGITTLGASNGIGTVTIGIGSTALYVDGNARITGILSIGQGTITLDGINNSITVGTALTVTQNTMQYAGIISATSFTGSVVGVSSSAQRLATSRTINGISFDGTANIITNPSSGAYSNGYGTRTLSNGAPSGGASGDVHYRY